MQPNPQSLVNMATNSDRNISSEQQAKNNSNTRSPEFIAAIEGIKKQIDLSDKAKIKTEAVKFDSGKVDWSLVPFEALEDMVKVLEFGAKKYDRWNWTTGGGFKWTRVAASGMRHLFAWLRGEDTDPESGLSHIAHAQCNLLFLAYYIRNKNKMNKDDRNV